MSSRSTLLLLLLLSVVAPRTADAAVRVVATLPDLAAIADAVGGEHVRVEAIAAPTEDPHYVDPRPSHVITLNRADLLILNGLGLEEGWLPPLLTQARNNEITVGARGYLDASTLVRNLIGADRVVDRAMGDVHPGGNPHFTFDPRAARDVAIGVADALGRIDAAHAAAYQANLSAFLAELDTAIAAQIARFAALPDARRSVVVYHDSLVYVFDWLGLTQVSTVEPVPGVPPDPARVAEVVGTMRTRQVPLLAQEQYYPTNTSQRVADLASASLVVIAGGTNFEGGQTYLERVSALADALYAPLAQ